MRGFSVGSRDGVLDTGRRRPSYSDRLRTMNLISLSNRRLRGDLIYTFKVLKLGGDVTFFELRYDDRLRGHGLILTTAQYRATVRQNFLSVRVVKAPRSLT
jgi:hypothetical protein